MKRRICLLWSLLLSTLLVAGAVPAALAEGTEAQSMKLTLDAVDVDYALYSDGVNGVTDLAALYTYWYSGDSALSVVDGVELRHNERIWTMWDNRVASFGTVNALSAPLAHAAENGALFASAWADVASPSNKSKNSEPIAMTLAGTSTPAVRTSDYQTIRLTDIPLSGETVALKFFNQDCGSGISKTQTDSNLYVRKPTLRLTSPDRTPAVIGTPSVEPEAWTNRAKVLSVPVTDDLAGVRRLLVTDESGAVTEVSAGKNTRETVFAVTIPHSGSYSIVAEDNVGNRSEPLVYTERHIDLTAPAAPGAEVLSPLSAKGWLHASELELMLAGAAEIGSGSEEILCFSTDGSLPAPVRNADGSFDRGAQNVLTFGQNTIPVPTADAVRVRIAAYDLAGNCTEAPEILLKVDPNVYEITANCLSGGSITASCTEARRGEEVTFSFAADEGYELWQLLVNGEAVEQASPYAVEVNGSLRAELKTRKVLDMTPETLTYSYRRGKPVTMLFAASNVPVEQLTVTYLDADGNAVEAPVVVGRYTAIFAVPAEDEQYVGSLTFAMTVEKLELFVALAEEAAVYDGTEHVIEVLHPEPEIADRYVVTVTGTPLHAGSYPVRVVIDAENFSGSLETVFRVLPRPVTVTAAPQKTTYGESWSFDENAYAVENALAAEPLTFALRCALAGAEGLATAGRYPIVVEQRPELTDYEITYEHAEAVVARRAVEVRADNVQKTYGAAQDPALTWTQGELPAGAEPLVIRLTREDGERAGRYAIRLAEGVEADNPNYELLFTPGEFRIKGALLVLLARNCTAVYGEAPVFSVLVLSGEPVTFQAGDFALENAAAVPGAGSYQIVLGDLSERLPGIEIVFYGATCTVTPRPVVVTADAAGKTYGDADPALTYAVEGLPKNGAALTGALSREPGEGAGRYAIVQGTLGSDNYLVTFVGAEFSIAPRALTVTAADLEKTYGDADPALSYVAEGLVAGDSLAGALSREPGENAGRYAIVRGDLANENYTVTFVGGTLTILPREVAVSAQLAEKVYGEADPALRYTCAEAGLDDLGLVLSRAPGEDAGSYEIFWDESVAVNPNYRVVSFEKSALTVRRATLELRLEDETVVYDGRPKTALASNAPAGLELVFSFRCRGETVDAAVAAGKYDVTATFAGSNNYEPAESPAAVLTVAPCQVYFTVTENRFVYDGQPHLPEFVGSEESTEALVTFVDGEIPTEPGSYAYTITVADANYAGSMTGVLTILQPGSYADDKTEVSLIAGAPLPEALKLELSTEGDVLGADTKTLENNGKVRNVLVHATFAGAEDYTGSVRAKIAFAGAEGRTDLKLYALDKSGGARRVTFSVENGYLVFETEDLASSYVLTEDRKSNWLSWTIAGGGCAAAIGTAVVIFMKVKAKGVS